MENEMKPSRDLDALIAEKVMGWKRVKPNLNQFNQMARWMLPDNTTRMDAPCFSTDIAAAWEVVEKMKWFVTIQKNPNTMSKYDNRENPEELKWSVKLSSSHKQDIYVYGATAPHAICLAALATTEIS